MALYIKNEVLTFFFFFFSKFCARISKRRWFTMPHWCARQHGLGNVVSKITFFLEALGCLRWKLPVWLKVITSKWPMFSDLISSSRWSQILELEYPGIIGSDLLESLWWVVFKDNLIDLNIGISFYSNHADRLNWNENWKTSFSFTFFSESTIHTACIGCLKALMNNTVSKMYLLAPQNCVGLYYRIPLTHFSNSPLCGKYYSAQYHHWCFKPRSAEAAHFFCYGMSVSLAHVSKSVL